jgi:hypothetical protein
VVGDPNLALLAKQPCEQLIGRKSTDLGVAPEPVHQKRQVLRGLLQAPAALGACHVGEKASPFQVALRELRGQSGHPLGEELLKLRQAALDGLHEEPQATQVHHVRRDLRRVQTLHIGAQRQPLDHPIGQGLEGLEHRRVASDLRTKVVQRALGEGDLARGHAQGVMHQQIEVEGLEHLRVGQVSKLFDEAQAHENRNREVGAPDAVRVHMGKRVLGNVVQDVIAEDFCR